MNKDINLTALIEREKETFLSSFEKEEHFITENTRSHSGNGYFYITSCILGIFPTLLLTSPLLFFSDFFSYHIPLIALLGLVSYFSSVLYLLSNEENVLRFRFKRMFKKMLVKEIHKHTEENHLIDFNILPISDEIHNAVKINFSMDEYKHLLSFGRNNKISYGQLLKFSQNREHYKKERQAIEEAKNSVNLSPSEIKAYQMEHLS